MKKILCLFVFVSLFFSCQKEHNKQSNLDYVDVHLSIPVSADITISEDTRAGGRDDLYAVQVYYYTSDNTKEPYAYAIFDNPANITLRLIKGYSYDFETMVCVDGYNVLRTCGRSYVNGFSEQVVYPVRNTEFTYTERYLSLVNSRLDIKGESQAYFMQALSLYRGTNSKVSVPEGSNATISLNASFISGKLRFVAENLSSGYVKTSGLIKPINLTPQNPTYESVYAKGEYDTSSPISVYYVDEDGMQQLVGEVQIFNITPQKTKTITITLKEANKKTASLSINLEDYDGIQYPEGDSYSVSL